MKIMLLAWTLLAWIPAAFAAGSATNFTTNSITARGAWSDITNGLRGRLEIVADPNKFNSGQNRFAQVFLEIENPSTTNQALEIPFRLTPPISAKIIGADGGPLPNVTGGRGSEQYGRQPWVIQPGSSEKFDLNRRGSSFSSSKPGLLIALRGGDTLFSNCWVVPYDASEDYFLSAVLSVPASTNAPANNWFGEMKLPPVKIPRLAN